MREMSVVGSFYPNDKDEIVRYFKHFSIIYDEHVKLPTSKDLKAVIVPHAGYVYSGFSANIAYRILKQSSIKRFLIIGPSHRVGFLGISICEENSYKTPFGLLDADINLKQELQTNFNLKQIIKHQEHSTEVQFPFVKYYIKDATIVELMYSKTSSSDISKIIDFVLKKDDCGVIISTDLSHFHPLDKANIIDSICIKDIKTLNENITKSGCEACGIVGVEAMLKSAKRLNLTPHILDYRTSADVSRDKSRVVGYVSVYFD